MFDPKFTISNKITNALTAIERARGFLEAATLSDEWLGKMQNKALVREAYHTTHIEGTQLTLEQSEQLWKGKHLAAANSDDVKELLLSEEENRYVIFPIRHDRIWNKSIANSAKNKFFIHSRTY